MHVYSLSTLHIYSLEYLFTVTLYTKRNGLKNILLPNIDIDKRRDMLHTNRAFSSFAITQKHHTKFVVCSQKRDRLIVKKINSFNTHTIVHV